MRDASPLTTRRISVEDSIISRIPLFEGLSPEEQEELRAMMTQTTLRRGETLFNEGDSGDRLIQIGQDRVYWIRFDRTRSTNLHTNRRTLATRRPVET